MKPLEHIIDVFQSLLGGGHNRFSCKTSSDVSKKEEKGFERMYRESTATTPAGVVMLGQTRADLVTSRY